MKKILFLLFILFTNCEILDSDSNEININKSEECTLPVGKWELIEIYSIETDNGKELTPVEWAKIRFKVTAPKCKTFPYEAKILASLLVSFTPLSSTYSSRYLLELMEQFHPLLHCYHH